MTKFRTYNIANLYSARNLFPEQDELNSSPGGKEMKDKKKAPTFFKPVEHRPVTRSQTQKKEIDKANLVAYLGLSLKPEPPIPWNA